MALRRKIDDEIRRYERARTVDEHLSGDYFLFLTGLSISGKIFREGVFELQCDAPPHDTNAVHRINKRFGIGFKDVTRSIAYHGIVL